MNATELIINSPEKFATSEIKDALLAKFPEANTHSTGDRLLDLYILFDSDIWNWLQQYYLFPKQITQFEAIGEWEGNIWIEIPFAG